jgi:hypothetical protein
MANIGEIQSSISIFDPPELSVESRIYSLMHRPLCGNKLESGSFYGVAVNPTHGTKISSAPANTEYSIFSKSGASFSSSMVGALIRFSNLDIDSLSYASKNGKSSTFVGTTNTDFIAKIKEVNTSTSLRIDKPIVISNVSLETGAKREDSPYFENFEEYYVTNIKNGSYEIVHSPRIDTSLMTNSLRVSSLVSLTFKNLKVSSSPDTFRILKRSSNTPESFVTMATGRVEPKELFLTNNANVDFINGGKFYTSLHAQTYWLASSGLTYTHTPTILIDSITLNTAGAANDSETAYVIYKENSGEVGRNSTYVPNTYITSSAWYTSPQLFPNFEKEPNTYYSCSVASPRLLPYTSSIEVVNNGAILNSNPLKLLKNTLYQFSIDWANIKPIDSDYKVSIYFVTTTIQGSTQKLLLGELDKDTATTYNGTYINKFYANKTMFGTVIIVPKRINTIAIANVSMKAYKDINYALDSFIVDIPFTPLLQNEKIEIIGELFDSVGSYCAEPIKTHLYADPQGWTEQLVGTVIGDILIDGGTP